jgi:hypothetical protein
MIIEYTTKSLQGENGPNVYYMGNPEEYWQALSDLRVLGMKNTEINLNKMSYIKANGGLLVVYRSSDNGNILLQKKDNTLLTELTCGFWQAFMHYFLTISFDPSHCYVDLDDIRKYTPLVEDANIIMSSEW